MTPLALSLLLLAPGAEPPASADPKPVPATREEVKDLLEAHKKARPRLPLPPAGDGPYARVNNGRFRQFYLPPEVQFAGLGGRDGDPAMTLDNTFKVKLFWVTSRANNCYYCLGHQEHKLLAAGVSDDGIAALDGDWAKFPPKERAALEFTRKLTYEPHKLSPADVAAMTAHYSPTQVLELAISVGGYNAMNRWTDGLNIPAEEDGNFFKKGDGPDMRTFKTPTSSEYANAPSLLAALPAQCKTASAPSWPARPALEDRAAVEAAWQAARTRTAVLPVADEAAIKAAWADGSAPHWARLLATFPKAGAGWAKRLKVGAEAGQLSPRVKALIAWTAARHDRAWYALAAARDRLKAVGLSDDQIFAVDAGGKDLSEAERAVVAFARKLAVAPATVTDADVEGLRKLYPDKAVAEVVHLVCDAAFFDRVTEAAQLPLDR